MTREFRASLRRLRTVLCTDLAYHLRRPLFIIWGVILVLSAYLMSSGSMKIQSGDVTVGGAKAYVTSEFAVAMQLAVLTTLIHMFFVSVAAGMTVIQDEEWQLGDLLHATSLRPLEYVWGKFAAVLAACFTMLGIQLAAMVFFCYAWPNAEAQEMHGPLRALHYLRPAVTFSLPTILFYAGVSFSAGEWTRRPLLVFLLPVAVLLFGIFFVWTWSPGWLDPRINDALMWTDPSGFRWLEETWLKVDRGVNFYNNAAIPLDRGFLISRAVFTLLGLGAVAQSARHFRVTLRGDAPERASRSAGSVHPPRELLSALEPPPAPLSSLGMTAAPPGLLAATWQVARVELAELRSSPGLYLFVPLILLQTLAANLIEVSFLDTALLITAGTFAVRTLGSLTTLLCLLLLFYTVGSLDRERSTRLAEVSYATPVRTGSLLLGKGVAIALVGLVVIFATLLAGVIAILVQQKVGLEIRPFLLVWGLLLLPTVLVWTAFVTAVHTITRNRYTTCALGLAVIALTWYRLLTDQANWVENWPLWRAVSWSDISVLELDRKALVLSRLFALALAVFLFAVSLRCFRRREWDLARLVHRNSRVGLVRASWPTLLWGLPPLFLGIWLALEVSWGYEGAAAKKRHKDYWRKNVATYRDARVPDIKRVELSLDLFPDRSRYHVQGTYELFDGSDPPLREILLTAAPHWEKLHWTIDERPCSPENRAGLYVFTPPAPWAKGKVVRIGFEHEGAYPSGISKRRAEASEFILPSAVVLTSIRGSIVPVLGFVEEIGIDDENRHDSKDYPDDFYKGQTDSLIGTRLPFTTRIRITGPADFTLNSVGTKTADTIKNDRRTVVWESDHPVNLFNVIAGRWQVERGEGTAVYYDPAHTYNISEIRTGLDAARRYFSQWFYPYPWRELKLSEFPNLATYAQGFPTNITFSEGVGFLTYSSAENHAAFEITAHEAAHQWWGNLLMPGKGPGGNILAEGTAHFSTILLVEQVLGLDARIDFCKRIEANYARSRQADSERPLVKVDGLRAGDTTVTYDKGGWVFWMLLNQMGRERALAGVQQFIKTCQGNPDHPVLQDFLVAMRPFARDALAFDTFTHQWFFEVVLPEYRLHEPRKTASGKTWKVTAGLENAGSGTMPLEVAATKGERFTSKGLASADYQEARTTITLGKKESRQLAIDCSFEPERIVVDPDAKVLQLERKKAVEKF